MILASLGKLSVAQDLTSADEISENVISLAQSDWAHWTDVWWVVQVSTVMATAGTWKLALVLATAAGLGTNIEVCSVLVAAITESRVATVGRNVVALNVGKMLKDIMEESGDTYYFLGMENTISASTTVSVNASISFTEPPTIPHEMVTVSPAGAASIASAGSGF